MSFGMEISFSLSTFTEKYQPIVEEWLFFSANQLLNNQFGHAMFRAMICVFWYQMKSLAGSFRAG